MSRRVLVVDDEKLIVKGIRYSLEQDGMDVDCAYDGEEALKLAKENAYDIILLDIMLPKHDGFEVCQMIREFSDVPIIMLTAKGETFDKVLGLELGADDYIVKPFDAKELVARVKAVLRRYEAGSAKGEEEDGQVLRYPDLEINLSNYTVMYHGKSVDFPPKEFELLHFLASNPKRVFTREQLLDRIWGYEYAGDTRTVDVHVKRIREKLNQDDEWGIRTVWSVGYKFGPK